jgi:hypothetical protein
VIVNGRAVEESDAELKTRVEDSSVVELELILALEVVSLLLACP